MATLQKTQDSTSLMKPPKAAAPAARAAVPSAEKIAARAYAIWEESGRPEGCEQEHWYQAESELRSRSLR